MPRAVDATVGGIRRGSINLAPVTTMALERESKDSAGRRVCRSLGGCTVAPAEADRHGGRSKRGALQIGVYYRITEKRTMLLVSNSVIPFLLDIYLFWL